MKNILENYAIKLNNSEDSILSEIRRETYLKVLMPRMISGPFQGQLLEMLSKMLNPATILEIGTFTAYSSICLAKGLRADGKLHTIEYNDELEVYIKKNITKSGLESQIISYIGDALEIIPKLNQKFDLIFIDADKRHYLDYYHAVFDKVKKNGFILADNIFWDGKVFEEVEKNDLYTQGIINFNTFIKQDKRVEHFTMPVRDGLMLIRKIVS